MRDTSKEFSTFPWVGTSRRNGKQAKNPEDYAINVRRYPFKTYFKEEVKAIREYRRSPTGESDSSCPHLPFAFLFHPSEPRVGFAVEKSEEPRSCESKFEALETMFNYAKDQNLTKINAKGGDEGCHLCLVLDRKSHGKSPFFSTCPKKFWRIQIKADCRKTNLNRNWYSPLSLHNTINISFGSGRFWEIDYDLHPKLIIQYVAVQGLWLILKKK